MTTPAYHLGDARHNKGKKVLQPLDGRDGIKGRCSYLAEALGGRWVYRSKGYIMSLSASEKFVKLFEAGFEADVRVYPGQKPTVYHRQRKLENLTTATALKMTTTED